MKLIRDNYDFYEAPHGCVATLGNFDGIHQGHQALLRRLKQEKQALGMPAVVITFEPLPREFFSKDAGRSRLMRFKEKWLALLDYSIDYVLCLPFNRVLAGLSPQDFVQQVLVDQLNVKAIIVGDDCRFGARRSGDYNVLQTLSKRYRFYSIVLSTILDDGQRISSTRIREALQVGNLAKAAGLLGRPYRLSGRVMHGNKRGSLLGFPTANIHLRKSAFVLSGVFVVQVLLNDVLYRGVASIGDRPTFPNEEQSIVLEVYIFDFNLDIYGDYLSVYFLHRLRLEACYPSQTALVDAMEKDVRDAKSYFEKKTE